MSTPHRREPSSSTSRRLSRRHSSFVPPAATRDEFLDSHLSDQAVETLTDERCPVCWDLYIEVGVQPVQVQGTSGCTHVLCMRCVRRYTSESAAGDRCPCCRQTWFLHRPARDLVLYRSRRGTVSFPHDHERVRASSRLFRRRSLGTVWQASGESPTIWQPGPSRGMSFVLSMSSNPVAMDLHRSDENTPPPPRYSHSNPLPYLNSMHTRPPAPDAPEFTALVQTIANVTRGIRREGSSSSQETQYSSTSTEHHWSPRHRRHASVITRPYEPGSARNYTRVLRDVALAQDAVENLISNPRLTDLGVNGQVRLRDAIVSLITLRRDLQRARLEGAWSMESEQANTVVGSDEEWDLTDEG